MSPYRANSPYRASSPYRAAARSSSLRGAAVTTPPQRAARGTAGADPMQAAVSPKVAVSPARALQMTPRMLASPARSGAAPSSRHSTALRGTLATTRNPPPRQKDPGVGALRNDLHGVTHLLDTRHGARAQKWTSHWAHGLRGGPDAEDEEEDMRRRTGKPPWRGVGWNDRRATRTRPTCTSPPSALPDPPVSPQRWSAAGTPARAASEGRYYVTPAAPQQRAASEPAARFQPAGDMPRPGHAARMCGVGM